MILAARWAVRLAALLALACAAGASAASPRDLSLTTADGPRHALVFEIGPGPRPTLIILHGALGTASQTARDTGLAQAAAARGFNAVFADGLRRRWHDGRAGGEADGPDDVAFLRALAARLTADRIAAPGRLYLAGISNGGMMTLAMACKAPGLFAGYAAVISSMPAGLGACPLVSAPLVMIDGTADPMVPYDGGEVGLRGGRGRVLGVMATARMFAAADGCGATHSQRLPHRRPDDPTRAERISWACGRGGPLILYRIAGGGHAWPGGRPLALGLLGPSTQDLDPAALIMDAFAAKPAG